MTPLTFPHRPLLDRTPRAPRHAGELARFDLDAEHLERFHAEGWTGPIRVLEEAEVVELRERLDRLAERLLEREDELYEIEAAWKANPAGTVLHFLGAWLLDEGFHDLVFDPRITVPVARCLGVTRLRFWHDQVFAKPPRHPGVVPWHQDYSYWMRTAPACHATLNLVLDDADEESGCLHVVPGSHRWPLQPTVAFDGSMDALEQALPAGLRQEFRPVPIKLRAGEASIHHCFTVHGSFENRSARPRRAAVLNYMHAETRVADDARPLLRGVAELPRGARVEGSHFPIVLDLLGLSLPPRHIEPGQREN